MIEIQHNLFKFKYLIYFQNNNKKHFILDFGLEKIVFFNV